MVKNPNVLYIKDNSIIKIKDYKKEIHKNNLICINCKEKMFAKNKGKILIHHFAHNHNCLNNCSSSGESELHHNFKTELYELLRQKINNNKGFFIKNICTKNEFKNYKKPYELNILKNINEIGVENIVGNYRPDITLYSNNIPIIIIEIVYKHDINENTFKYYKNESINIFKIYINEDEDIENIKKGIIPKIIIDEKYHKYYIHNNLNKLKIYDKKSTEFIMDLKRLKLNKNTINFLIENDKIEKDNNILINEIEILIKKIKKISIIFQNKINENKMKKLYKNHNNIIKQTQITENEKERKRNEILKNFRKSKEKKP